MAQKNIIGAWHPHAAATIVVALLTSVGSIAFVIATEMGYPVDAGGGWHFKLVFLMASVTLGLVLTMPSREKRLEYAKKHIEAMQAEFQEALRESAKKDGDKDNTTE